MARTTIFTPSHIHRILDRLASEVIERNGGTANLEIIGIRTRGSALAVAIANRLARFENRSFAFNKLDIGPYRDDITPEAPRSDSSQINVDINDRDVLLIDDVIFTGRTARAALDAVVAYGRPRSIQLLVLIDRGHREYPIQPDYAGRVIPTKHKERVIVETGDDLFVYLEE